MKKYKSETRNKGTTIILDSVNDAIKYGESALNNPTWLNEHYKGSDYLKQSKEMWSQCIHSLTHGDEQFGAKIAEIIDKLLDIVDQIEPTFSMNRQGFERSAEDGIITTPELLQSNEEKVTFKPKYSDAHRELKKGSGEGAYRIIINTDVWFNGLPEDNCAMVGALIELLQRFAPVEVWIQQGWLGGDINDGVTLFKLDYTLSMDITSLTFWINHPYKDSVFSYLVNRGLGRKSTATSCVSEIENDIMFRGDLQEMFGFSDTIADKLYTEKMDLTAAWIAHTAYKLLFNTDEPPPFLSEPSDS